MKVEFFAHSETFKPAWRATELAWIEAYASVWKNSGAEVSFGHPLRTELSKVSLLHIFGSGHFEALAWAAPQAAILWLSPFPFSAEDTDVTQPESRARSISRYLWRFVRGQSALNLHDRACLTLPKVFLVPAWGAEELRRWGIPDEKIFIAPQTPHAAAEDMRKLPLKEFQL